MGKAKKRVTPANIALEVSKQKKFNQKVHRIKKNVQDGPAKTGVVYVSHLPWGFEEKPLKEYFQQFGSIRQLRVARSKKTGNPRGFAYIQFAHEEVAKIVADTMNNYLMFGKLIKCQHLLNPHPNTFKHANRRFVKPMGVAGAIMKHNSQKSDAAVDKSQKKMLGKLAKLHAKLAEQGIEYKLEDANLNKAREALQKKKKEAKKKAAVEGGEKKNAAKDAKKRKSASVDKDDDESDDDESEDEETDDDETDDDDDDDDKSESSSDDNPAPATLKAGTQVGQKTPKNLLGTPKPGQKMQGTPKPGQKTPKNLQGTPKLGQKTPKNLQGTPKPVNSGATVNKSIKKTDKRQSLIPKEVDTPKGKMNVLIEDSSEDEISFKTPPMSIKSSKLDDTLKSEKATPVSTQKRSPKRKLEEKTPVADSWKGMGTVTPAVEVPTKKAKFLSKSAQKVNTPKISKVVNMPKSAQKVNSAKVDQSDKKEMRTPKGVSKSDGRPMSGRKSPGKKTLPSETKRKNLKK